MPDTPDSTVDLNDVDLTATDAVYGDAPANVAAGAGARRAPAPGRKAKAKPAPELPRFSPDGARQDENGFRLYCRKWETYFGASDAPVVSFRDYWELPEQMRVPVADFERQRMVVQHDFDTRKAQAENDADLVALQKTLRARDARLTRAAWDAHCEETRMKLGPFWAAGKIVGKEGSEVPDLGRAENTQAMLSFLKIDCYMSDMTHEPVYRRHNVRLDLDPVVAEIRECARRYCPPGLTREVLREHLWLIADKVHKHEFVEWLKTACPDNDISKWKWDGTDYSSLLMDTLTLADGADRELAKTMLYYWSLQVALALTQPRGQYRGVLLLVGPENEGKSRWVASLAPAECVLAGQAFDPSNKDHVRAFCSRTISEMSEIDVTFRKHDLALLKAFLGRDVDVFRIVYDMGESHWGRRTVSVATCNPDSEGRFLADKGTRWWVVPITHCNADHKIDMRQYWLYRLAQLQEMQATGQSPYPSRDLMAMFVENSETFRATSPIEQAVKDLCTLDADARTPPADIADAVKQHLNLSGWSQSDAREVSRALKRLGAETKARDGYPHWTVRVGHGLPLVLGNGIDKLVAGL